MPITAIMRIVPVVSLLILLPVTSRAFLPTSPDPFQQQQSIIRRKQIISYTTQAIQRQSPRPQTVQLYQQQKLEKTAYFVPGPPVETKPDYDNIHGPLGKAVDDVFLSMFREKLAEQVGVDSDKPKVR
jgi:hypothetical protein